MPLNIPKPENEEYQDPITIDSKNKIGKDDSPVIGWACEEVIGVSIINPRAISKLVIKNE